MSVVTIAKFFPASDLNENIIARITGGKRREDWEKANKRKPEILPTVIRRVQDELINRHQQSFIKRIFAQYNKYCGCTSCPCSPGFDIKVETDSAYIFRSRCYPHIYGHRDGSLTYREESIRYDYDGNRARPTKSRKHLSESKYLLMPVSRTISIEL